MQTPASTTPAAAGPAAEVELLRSVGPALADLERMEGAMLQYPQVECPVTHHFAPGIYVREALMPKGAFVIGHEHKTEHLNVALSGSASVLMEGVVQRITAPFIVKSAPGVRKMFYVHEDLRWATIHPTTETDVAKLEEQLVVKSDTFKEHQAMLEMAKFKQVIENGGNA